MPTVDVQIWGIALIFFVVGACIGSFLNVVIYRVPLGLSVRKPERSFCPMCGKTIPFRYNIPLFGWLWLRGKSACCGQAISGRYWVVELLCALLFAGIAYRFFDISIIATVCLCVWVALGLVILCIDVEHMIVFRRHTVVAAVAAIIAACYLPSLLLPEPQEYAVWGSVAGGATGFCLIRVMIGIGRLLFGSWQQHFDRSVKWSIREPENEQEDLQLIVDGKAYEWGMLFHRKQDHAVLSGATLYVDEQIRHAEAIVLYEEYIETNTGERYALENIRSAHGTLTGIRAKREAMGGGDAWIMMAIGCLAGWQGVICCLFLAALCGLMQALCARVGLGRPMPFGPALICASVIWLFGGEYLWQFYWAWFGEPPF